MKRISYLLIVVTALAMVILFSGCTKEKIEAQSMEKIHKKEGVPVRTLNVTPTTFKKELNFYSVLTGIKESTAFSAMGDKVETILVKVGDYVRKDQVLITFPTDSPAASYFQAKVAYENARAAYKRIDGLYKSGGISLQDRDNANAQFQVSKADWNNVNQMIKVKAPISGYVTKVHVSETDNVDKEMPLVTIARTEKLKAAIWVSEDEISQIRTGMKASASWKGNQIEGTVTQVDIAMNDLRKAFRAVVEFTNPDKLLFAGTTVNVSITTSRNAAAVVVERKNILEEQKKHFVFVVKNQIAQKRDITLGSEQNMDIEILQGLQPGDQLVIEGQLLLSHGSKVKIIDNHTQ
ncbi:MAG: efflux RND transporter periplasmic adaptor subunit [bacterium]|nr:efflux RND transporter periplasmic adaptor subunit [bacterium]